MTSTGDLQAGGTTAQNAASNLSNTASIPEGCHLEPPSTSIDPQPSEPVEMSDLSPQTRDANIQAVAPPNTDSVIDPKNLNENREVFAATSSASTDPNHVPSFSNPSGTLHESSEALNMLMRQQTQPAIGPATDKPSPVSKTPESAGPQLIITLLLHTGARHPYRIDEKYLKKRNVSVADNNPVNMSVYTLKELIWRDWREEWDPRPSSPSSIRLIHYGKMLDDKSHLKDGRFTDGDTPHVVHMTIKPQEVVDDEDARIAKGGARDRDGNERTPGCRCIIM